MRYRSPSHDRIAYGRIYAVSVSVSGCHKAHGEAASTKLNTVAHSYYDGILTTHTPAIDHGQDSDRGGHCGLELKARVRKVTNLTPRRNGRTQRDCDHTAWGLGVGRGWALGEAMPGRVVPLAKWKPTNSWDRAFLRLPDDPNGEGELYHRRVQHSGRPESGAANRLRLLCAWQVFTTVGSTGQTAILAFALLKYSEDSPDRWRSGHSCAGDGDVHVRIYRRFRKASYLFDARPPRGSSICRFLFGQSWLIRLGSCHSRSRLILFSRLIDARPRGAQPTARPRTLWPTRILSILKHTFGSIYHGAMEQHVETKAPQEGFALRQRERQSISARTATSSQSNACKEKSDHLCTSCPPRSTCLCVLMLARGADEVGPRSVHVESLDSAIYLAGMRAACNYCTVLIGGV